MNNTSEGRSFFHLDFLGSTANLTDAFEGTRQSILYDAWGNERDRVGVSANNFTFTGHEKDEETALIYGKARFYDPDIGRFLTQDSYLGDVANAPSLHRYAYASSNPPRFVDPDGRAALDLVKGLAVGAGTALVIVAAVATLPVTIPTSVAVGLAAAGIAVTTATVVQSTRQRDLLNNPISEEQADYQMGTALGGLVVAAGSGPMASSMSGAMRPMAPALAGSTGTGATVVVEATTAAPALAPALTQAAGGVTSTALPIVLAMSSTGEGGGGGSNDDETSETDGPQEPRSPLSDDVNESFPEQDGRTYRNGLRPDTPVRDHREARALGGLDEEFNLHTRAWSENSRKGWHEGNYLKLKKQYMEEGLSEQHAEWVLEDYKQWFMEDIHATPVDPAQLDTLRSP